MSHQKLSKIKKLLIFSALLAILVLISIMTHACFGTFVPSKKIPANATSDFALLAEAWNTVQKVYVDRSVLKPRQLIYGAISGMVDSLGDTGHSTFLTPEMIKEQQKVIEGRYKGVGIEIRMENGRTIIVAPLDGSPAQKAGLRSGEVITAVDGKNLIGLNLIQIVKLISGPAGTKVTLTILDPATNSSKDIMLIRASITEENVRWKYLADSGIVQLRIASFSNGVTNDLGEALNKIRQRKTRGIILDLRDDPGGLLEEAVGCTSLFLKEGNVLLEKNAAGKIRPIPVKHERESTQILLVVLVNEGTASAAEIMAGAIQDAGRAKLVGTKTFGTGTVLGQFSLSDGSALMLAVEEWLTPKGRSIWHKGITPDIDVRLPAGIRPLFPTEETKLSQAKLQASGDSQLLTAVKLFSEEK
ncbi:MAG: S41 family peptidase [Desulfuromonadaceae bacterium]|nr:S41 family peptidase [Desulfuromonadaceae bacterium]